MSKIDIDRFVCDMMELDVVSSEFKYNLSYLLKEQGLEYADGEIQSIPMSDEQKAYIDELTKNCSTARIQDLAYAPRSIEEHMEEFRDIFRQLEREHGRCSSVKIEHGNEMRDSMGEVVAENIEVDINF